MCTADTDTARFKINNAVIMTMTICMTIYLLYDDTTQQTEFAF